MELETRIEAALGSLYGETRIDRGKLVDLLEALREKFSTSTCQSEPEHTPQRTKVRNWHLGVCKRCLENDVHDGDVIVRIFGKGWWHDECFRVVRPDYYRGL